MYGVSQLDVWAILPWGKYTVSEELSICLIVIEISYEWSVHHPCLGGGSPEASEGSARCIASGLGGPWNRIAIMWVLLLDEHRLGSASVLYAERNQPKHDLFLECTGYRYEKRVRCSRCPPSLSSEKNTVPSMDYWSKHLWTCRLSSGSLCTALMFRLLHTPNFILIWSPWMVCTLIALCNALCVPLCVCGYSLQHAQILPWCIQCWILAGGQWGFPGHARCRGESQCDLQIIFELMCTYFLSHSVVKIHSVIIIGTEMQSLSTSFHKKSSITTWTPLPFSNRFPDVCSFALTLISAWLFLRTHWTLLKHGWRRWKTSRRPWLHRSNASKACIVIQRWGRVVHIHVLQTRARCWCVTTTMLLMMPHTAT